MVATATPPKSGGTKAGAGTAGKTKTSGTKSAAPATTEKPMWRIHMSTSKGELYNGSYGIGDLRRAMQKIQAELRNWKGGDEFPIEFSMRGPKLPRRRLALSRAWNERPPVGPREGVSFCAATMPDRSLLGRRLDRDRRRDGCGRRRVSHGRESRRQVRVDQGRATGAGTNWYCGVAAGVGGATTGVGVGVGVGVTGVRIV